MTRYRGRICSEEPPLQSDRSARTSLVEPPERQHVFALSIVGQATETDLARKPTIRGVPRPFLPATGARRLNLDEGRGG